MSNEATRFCDRLGINRLVVGTEAYHSKGAIERHIGLTKHSILKLKQAYTQAGFEIDYNNLVHESCCAQNALLDYGGCSPQMALTG